mmetsp:Transcript_22719/g.37571  ORF Transcript_22719/g.37571 Transcript_22719/m.37571 type:complete len:228 (+) Transcript_22719:34-717(+)
MASVEAAPSPATEQSSVEQSGVEDFIREYSLDERVSKGLRELPERLQLQVISGPMGQARNPSAVVWSRVRVAQQQEKQSTHGQMQVPAQNFMPAAMPAPVAMQAGMLPVAATSQMPGLAGGIVGAKRGVDQLYWPLQPTASATMPSMYSVSPPALMGVPMVSPTTYTAPTQDVEQWLSANNIDERCAKGLRELPPHKQARVMETDLSASRNRSAMTWSRIRAVQREM